MKYKIAFFTEGQYQGKVANNHPNLRTDLAWIHHLDADHFNLYNTPLVWPVDVKYDIGIVIVPKGRPDAALSILTKLNASCKLVGIMQEGPADYWTEYTLIDQFTYLELLSKVDFILAHNELDVSYFRGLTDTIVGKMPSVMVEQSIPKRVKERDLDVIIGGNMCKWYNGMASLLVAREYADDVHIPSMGRKVPGESRIERLHHLPYMNWSKWMEELSRFKVGVHLMPTFAAGTFALNCAVLGIPCIGYDYVDTQRILHPNLSVKLNDIEAARNLSIRLKEDHAFYEKCAQEAMTNYEDYYNSTKYKETMQVQFDHIWNHCSGI